MDLARKKALLEATLTRAAEQLGDITPHVYARYYAGRPHAEARFAELHPGGQHQLEGQMVEQVLYCLMEWQDCPGEIEIILLSTLPHHIDTLHVSADYFTGLLGCVCDVIAETIPAARHDERAVLDGLRATLLEICSQGASYARTQA